MRDERTGIVAPSVHGHIGFTTSGALKQKKRAEVTFAKRQQLQDASARRTSTESIMTHVVNAAVVALGSIFAGRGFPESQVSAVEQADDTGAEKPPTNDTHMELVSHPVAVPVSTRSSARLAEQSRKRSAGDI